MPTYIFEKLPLQLWHCHDDFHQPSSLMQSSTTTTTRTTTAPGEHHNQRMFFNAASNQITSQHISCCMLCVIFMDNGLQLWPCYWLLVQSIFVGMSANMSGYTIAVVVLDNLKSLGKSHFVTVAADNGNANNIGHNCGRILPLKRVSPLQLTWLWISIQAIAQIELILFLQNKVEQGWCFCSWAKGPTKLASLFQTMQLLTYCLYLNYVWKHHARNMGTWCWSPIKKANEALKGNWPFAVSFVNAEDKITIDVELYLIIILKLLKTNIIYLDYDKNTSNPDNYFFHLNLPNKMLVSILCLQLWDTSSLDTFFVQTDIITNLMTLDPTIFRHFWCLAFHFVCVYPLWLMHAIIRVLHRLYESIKIIEIYIKCLNFFTIPE